MKSIFNKIHNKLFYGMVIAPTYDKINYKTYMKIFKEINGCMSDGIKNNIKDHIL